MKPGFAAKVGKLQSKIEFLGKGPLFSVVVPTYNRAEVLDHCLKALSKQFFPRKNFEVIVVDDGSTDNTKEVVEARGFKYLRQSHDGNASARNKGIKEANGKFICLLSDDCFASMHWLLERYKAHKSYPRDALIGPVYPYSGSNSGYATLELGQYNNFPANSVIENDWLNPANVSLLKSWFDLERFDERFKGSGIEDKLPFDTWVSKQDRMVFSGEDTELGYRLRKAGLKMRFCPSSPVWHDHEQTFAEHMALLGKRIRHDWVLRKIHPEILAPRPTMLLPDAQSFFDQAVCESVLFANENNLLGPKLFSKVQVTLAVFFTGKHYCLNKILHSIQGIDFDKKRMQILFCDYSKDPGFGKHLRQWVKKNKHLYGLALVDTIWQSHSVEKYLHKVKVEHSLSDEELERVKAVVVYDRLRKLSFGKQIFFMGDDVLVPGNCLCRMQKILKGKKIAGAAAACPSKDENGNIYQRVWNFLSDPNILPNSSPPIVCVSPKPGGTEFVSAVGFDCFLAKKPVLECLQFSSAYNRLHGLEFVLGAKIASQAGMQLAVDWGIKCKRIIEGNILLKPVGISRKELLSVQEHNALALRKSFLEESEEKQKMLQDLKKVEPLFKTAHKLKKSRLYSKLEALYNASNAHKILKLARASRKRFGPVKWKRKPEYEKFLNPGINGMLSDEEKKLLFWLGEKMADSKTIVEIGCLEGLSTFFLCKGAKNSVVYSIDLFDSNIKRQKKMVKEIKAAGDEILINEHDKPPKGKVEKTLLRKGLRNFELIEGLSEDIAKGWSKPIDLLWIDGNHLYKYVRQDFLNWSKFLKKGGIIAFHDSNKPDLQERAWNNGLVGPTRLVEEEIKPPKWAKVRRVDSITYATKNF